MELWLKILTAVLPVTVVLLFLIAFLHRRQRFTRLNAEKHSSETRPGKERLHSARGKFHLSYKANSSKHRLQFQNLNQQHTHQQNYPIRQQAWLFDWDDYPRLISEAVENGWSGFAFFGQSPLLHPQPVSLLDFCMICDYGRERAAEIDWEVAPGSSEFTQTVRLNPGSKRGSSNISHPLDGDDSCCCARMALPLPGPALGGSSFPQEAYFEITILHLQQLQKNSQTRKQDKINTDEDDRMNLIQENPVEVQSGNKMVHNMHGGGGDFNKYTVSEEEKIANEECTKVQDVVLSLGFTRGGSPPNKAPGSYPGSIGFNSNGAIYLDGMKLVFESDKVHWGAVNRVIGCGFDPSKKKVFFTRDSVLLHAIHCNSDAFKSPLYPSLAANANVMVRVNLGQYPFKYLPANAQRTPNPCFLRTLASNGTDALIGYEDSREFFSMERIDSKWHDRCPSRENKCNSSRNSNNSCNTTPETKRNNTNKSNGSVPIVNDATTATTTTTNNNNNNISNKTNCSESSVALDIDAESDLFEIVLNS